MKTEDFEKKLIDMIYKEANGRISTREAYASFIAYSVSKLNMAYLFETESNRNEVLNRYITSSEIDVKTLDDMFETLVCALEANPDQDFLGVVFEKLNLTNAKAGQFLTPYHVSKMMAQINMPQCNEKKVLSIADPCCGAGAMLIAAVNVIKETNQDPKKYLFYAQDIDWLMGMTTYVQLALQGVQGMIVIGNSLDPNTIPPKIMDVKDSYVLPMTYVYNPSLLKELKARDMTKKKTIDDRCL